MYDFITIGSAFVDTMFVSEKAELLTVQKPRKRQMMAFEYGGKYNLDTVSVTLGGGACNTAVDLRRLGAHVAPIAPVGRDSNGHHVIAELSQLGIDCSFIQQYNAQTGFSVIVTYGGKKNNGKEHIIFAYKGATQYLKIPTDLIKKARARNLYVTGLKTKSWKTVLSRIIAIHADNKKKDSSARLFWNPGSTQLEVGMDQLKKYMKHVDVLQVNRSEAFELMCSVNGKPIRNIKSLLKQIAEYVGCIVVITDGKKGAHAYHNGVYYYEPIFEKVKTIDTTGVGDCFGSTFAYMISQGKDIGTALQYASINAGYVSSVVGAQNGSLSLNKLHSIHKKYYT